MAAVASSYDLIVIGGGLVGGAIAWGAAAQGASVALLDEGDIAFRAARGNFGLVWVQSKGAGMPAYAHWTRRSVGTVAELAERAAPAPPASTSRCASPAASRSASATRRSQSRAALLHRMHNESGDIGTRMLDRAELRAMVPGLGDRVVGASFCPIDGHASPLHLLRALHAALLRPWRRVPARPQGRRDRRRAAQLHRPLRRRALHRREAGDRRRPRQPRPGADGRPGHAGQPLRGQILVTERLRPFLRLRHPRRAADRRRAR